MPRLPRLRRKVAPRKKSAARKKRVSSEHQEQVVLVARVRQFLPDVLIFAVPNGGLRNRRVAKQMKDEGLLAGVPDLVIAEARGGYHGLFLEMKRTRGGSLSDRQRGVGRQLRARGYYVAVAKGADEGVAVLEAYLALTEGARALLG